MNLDSWCEQEKSIFMEKFMQHSKKFHLIAANIEKKVFGFVICKHYQLLYCLECF